MVVLIVSKISCVSFGKLAMYAAMLDGFSVVMES